MQDALPFLIVGVPILLVLIWTIANYNRMVRLRNHITESWSNIDVELKRRYELVPNLVETVKGYAKHERDTLERVIELRNRAVASTGSANQQALDESALQIGLKQVFALAEGYPQLKADAHFLALQQELSLTEDRIAAARRFYNGNTRDLRQLCEQFPTSILASMFHVEPPEFFELESEAERVVPRVSLD
ncbi:MAG: LemA family protein [Planctomycetes bacterium]|nr:LemA family protein [Planctomycetota bacterium]